MAVEVLAVVTLLVNWSRRSGMEGTHTHTHIHTHTRSGATLLSTLVSLRDN